MTAPKIPELQVTNQPKATTLPDKKRNVTDKAGLACFLSFLFIWIASWIDAIYRSKNSVSVCQYSNYNSTNILWKHKSCINSSSGAVDTLLLSINSTIHVLNSSEVFSDFYAWHTLQFLWYFAVCYIVAESCLSLAKDCFRIDNVETRVHYMTIIMCKLMINWIIINIEVDTKYSYLHEKTYSFVPILFVLECLMYLAIFVAILLLTSKSSEKTIIPIGNVCRYYVSIRSLILFRVLHLIIILLFVATNIVVSKSLCSKAYFSQVIIYIGSVYLIFFINNYFKMVTMAASAYHEVSFEIEPISMKTILLAAFTIGKYHLGTLFLNTLCIRRLYALLNKNKLPPLDVSVEHFDKNILLTAIHGYNFDDATTKIMWLEAQNQLAFGTESYSATMAVWKNMYYTSLYIAFLYLLMPIESVEELLSKITEVAFFLTLHGAFNYVIIITEAIDYTIKYCKLESERNAAARDNQIKPEFKGTTITV